MKKLIKKMFMFSTMIAFAGLLAGCAGMCPQQHKKPHAKPAKQVQTVEYRQTYSYSDIDRVKGAMYTHSSNGGESKMGYIKFKDTDNGVKMSVDLKDLRPGVTYKTRVYQCKPCADNAMTCCGRSMVNADFPKLRIEQAGRLEDSYMIRGVTAAQLQNAQVYLERDGGYKAAWATLGKDNF